MHPPSPSHPWSHPCERKMVGAVSGQPPQPAVIVAGTTHATIMQVVQMSVVDTTAAQPETDSRDRVGEGDWVTWERAGAELGGGLLVWV